jgi:precorrin-3B synthase
MTPAPVLAPKLSVIIDGGARAGLAAVAADIRLMAVQADGRDSRWAVAVAGDSQTARRLAVLRSDEAIAAVITILKRLSEIGPLARGRDLDAATLETLFETGENISVNDRRNDAISPIGIHDLGEGKAAFGVRLPYAQIRSDALIAFLDRIEQLGISELRLAHGHGFILLSIRPGTLEETKLAAANFGLLTTPDDPRNQIQACAGSAGCASAFCDTKTAAAEIADSLRLFDGSVAIHLSGCSKGCAHPSRATLTLVGTPMGYGLVVNGSASNEPAAYIQQKELESALAALKRLVDQHKGAGESIDACLKRLGGDAVAKALDRDRNA